MSPTDDEPELPEYRGHTAAFGRLMRTAHEGQTTVSSMAPLVADLMKVRDEELVLLSQVRAVSLVMVWEASVAAEVARRTIAALALNRDAVTQSTAANDEALRLNREAIVQSTAANDEALRLNRAAIDQSTIAINKLRTATESWSKWLTRLTIFVVILTGVLVVLTIDQLLIRR